MGKEVVYSDTQKAVIQGHLTNAILHFEDIAADRDDIMIYMPDHFQNQFRSELAVATRCDSRLGNVKVVKYCGIDVLQGYENKVVVAVKDGALHNVEPVKIELI